MILSKLTSLLSSSLTLGPFSSQTPLATPAVETGPEPEPTTENDQPPLSETLEALSVPESLAVEETNFTSDVEINPLESFFDKLILKELVYESVLSFTDELPSTKLPLTHRPLEKGLRALMFVIKLGVGDHLHDEITYFLTKSATVKKMEQDILELRLSITYDSVKMAQAFGFDPYHIYNRQDFLFVLEKGPVRSAENLAKSIDGTISRYHFMTPRGINGLRPNGIDPLLFTYLSYANERLPNTKSDVRCALVPFAPWEYTSEDFRRFTSMAIFADGPENVDVIWAYILDICVETCCQFFVLTTYENWAFGRFSPTFGEAFISEPISNKAEVMKYLTYWILSSFSTPDTMDLDTVTRRYGPEYKIVEDEQSDLDEGRYYDLDLKWTKRPQDPMITYFPKPTKKWNRWYKRIPDQEQESSDDEEIGNPGDNDVDGGTENISEKSWQDVDEPEAAGVEGGGGPGEDTVSPQVTGKNNDGTGEDNTGEAGLGEDNGVRNDVSAEVTEQISSARIETGDNVTTGVEEDVIRETEIGEDHGAGVEEDVIYMKDMDGETDEDINMKDDALEHEKATELVESSNNVMVEESATIPMDVETARELEPNQIPCENDTMENIPVDFDLH